MPNAQVLTSISTFYWEVTPSGKSVLGLYSVSSIKNHQNMKKFCLMNIMFLKDKHEMVNKSFVLKENFYSRQVLTILSIPWKLPLKGYSIVVIISCFFLLFEVESLQKSNRTWFLDISVSQFLCHTRNNTRD